jgi:hypothetical protein
MPEGGVVIFRRFNRDPLPFHLLQKGVESGKDPFIGAILQRKIGGKAVHSLAKWAGEYFQGSISKAPGYGNVSSIILSCRNRTFHSSAETAKTGIFGSASMV